MNGVKKEISGKEEFDFDFILHSFLLLLGRWLHEILNFYDKQMSLQNSDKFRIYENLANRYCKKGKIDKAIKATKRAVKLAPPHEKGALLKSLANLYSEDDDPEKAKMTLEAILKKEPEQDAVRLKLADIYFKENNFKESLELYKKSLEVNGSNHEVMYKLGMIYDKIKEQTKAVFHLQEAIKLSPEQINYHQYLGFLHESMDNHKMAVPHFKKVMELEYAQKHND